MISGVFSDLDHRKTFRHDGILVIANEKCSLGVHFVSKLYNNPFVAILTPASSSLPTGE